MYTLYKHVKLKSLLTSLALQQIKEVGMVAKQVHFSIAQEIMTVQRTAVLKCSYNNAFHIRYSILCSYKIV